MTDNQAYLGDGVYALFDGRGIELRANSHVSPTDRIYLEPSVLSSLYHFVEKCYTRRKDEEYKNE